MTVSASAASTGPVESEVSSRRMSCGRYACSSRSPAPTRSASTATAMSGGAQRPSLAILTPPLAMRPVLGVSLRRILVEDLGDRMIDFGVGVLAIAHRQVHHIGRLASPHHPVCLGADEGHYDRS